MMSELLRQIGRPDEAALALAEAEADDVHLHEHNPGLRFEQDAMSRVRPARSVLAMQLR